MYPLNRKYATQMHSDVEGVAIGRGHIAHFHVAGADAITADQNAVLSTTALSATVPVVVTTGFVAPAVPRNITAYLWGTDTDVKAVSVILEGTNYAGEAITETLPAFTVNALTHVESVKAFKTVTKATIPAMDGAGVSITLGFGDILGLPMLLSFSTIQNTFLGGVAEGTAPTLVKSATVLESNTILLNSALDGSAVDVFFLV